MDVVSDDAKAEFRRIEVLTGPARRRRWSTEEKGRIVAETLQAETTVTEVARRWQLCPQQIWGWRREAREGHLVLPGADRGSTMAPNFVPIVAEAAASSAEVASEAAPERTPAATPCIEIRLVGAVVRVAPGTDPALLSDVLRAVRMSAR